MITFSRLLCCLLQEHKINKDPSNFLSTGKLLDAQAQSRGFNLQLSITIITVLGTPRKYTQCMVGMGERSA